VAALTREEVRLIRVIAVAGVAAVVALGSAVGSADAQVPRKYANCKALNARYLHGVGRVGARDRTKSGDPVTNFRRNNRLYERNKGLDRDRD
jgi:hypothetical protein